MTTRCTTSSADAERRCVGRVHGADEETTRSTRSEEGAPEARAGVDVELATQPPTRMAAKLARMATRGIRPRRARANSWQKRRDEQFDLSSSSE
jgi:hypothetical protein